MPSHPYLECLNTVFDKFVNALGVYVIATPEAPIDYVKHTANVLAVLITVVSTVTVFEDAPACNTPEYAEFDAAAFAAATLPVPHGAFGVLPRV